MRWLKRLFRRNQAEQELDRERADHLERSVPELIGQVTPRTAARSVEFSDHPAVHATIIS